MLLVIKPPGVPIRPQSAVGTRKKLRPKLTRSKTQASKTRPKSAVRKTKSLGSAVTGDLSNKKKKKTKKKKKKKRASVRGIARVSIAWKQKKKKNKKKNNVARGMHIQWLGLGLWLGQGLGRGLRLVTVSVLKVAFVMDRTKLHINCCVS